MKEQNQLQNLRNSIFGDKDKESSLIDIYHYLMIHYGYIPFEDYKKMDAALVNNLVDILNEMNKKNKGGKKW